MNFFIPKRFFSSDTAMDFKTDKHWFLNLFVIRWFRCPRTISVWQRWRPERDSQPYDVLSWNGNLLRTRTRGSADGSVSTGDPRDSPAIRSLWGIHSRYFPFYQLYTFNPDQSVLRCAFDGCARDSKARAHADVLAVPADPKSKWIWVIQLCTF